MYEELFPKAEGTQVCPDVMLARSLNCDLQGIVTHTSAHTCSVETLYCRENTFALTGHWHNTIHQITILLKWGESEFDILSHLLQYIKARTIMNFKLQNKSSELL